MLNVAVNRQRGVKALEASGVLDELYAMIDAREVRLDGKDGLIQQMIKAGLERGLQAELTEHVAYAKGDPEAEVFPNSRNGSNPKTVATSVGDVELALPRDRDGTFTPMLVPKGSRRLGGLDDMIISLYAGGMTVRNIEHHLVSTVGVEISRETIIVKVRDGAHVRNTADHIAVGVDMDGIKHVLGIWIQASDGAKFWAGVCAQLANRGIRDVLIVCCDGLTGFPEAIEATWPQATVQTCVVHLIRQAMRFVNYKSRKPVATALKTVYEAADEQAARAALDAFAASGLGKQNPHTIRVFDGAWERFTPFLAFPPMLRRVTYT